MRLTFPSWVGLGPWCALCVYPQHRQQAQGKPDVHERQQGEQAITDVGVGNEIPRHRTANQRQHIEPLSGCRDHELRQPVPRQHVAVDPGGEGEPQQQYAGNPRKPVKSPMVVEREMPDEMQQHGQHQSVGGMAMQAAQHAANESLAVRQRLHRGKRAGDTGLEKCVEIQAGRYDDPEQEIGDGAEVVKRIQPLAENSVDDFFNGDKCVLCKGLQ